MSVTNDELVHFGVKGMRWGHHKRYDTGSVQTGHVSMLAQHKAARQKKLEEQSKVLYAKAQEHADLARGIKLQGLNHPKLKELYPNSSKMSDLSFFMTYGVSKRKAVRKSLEQEVELAALYKHDAEARKNGRLTTSQKKMLGAAVVTAGVLAAVGVMSYQDIVTRNAVSGQHISYNNFLRRSNTSKYSSSLGMSMDAFNKLSNEDLVIKKGTSFFRISTDPEKTLRDRFFATFDQEDVARYKAALPDYWNAWYGRDSKRSGYQVEIKALNDIVSPSAKKRVEEYMNVLDQSFPLPDGTVKTGRQIMDAQRKLDLSLLFAPPTDKLSNKDYALKTYSNFAVSWAKETPLASEYFKRLQSQGYNALVDDNDAGSLGKTPMFILNAAMDMQRVGAKQLSAEALREAKKYVNAI